METAKLRRAEAAWVREVQGRVLVVSTLSLPRRTPELWIGPGAGSTTAAWWPGLRPSFECEPHAKPPQDRAAGAKQPSQRRRSRTQASRKPTGKQADGSLDSECGQNGVTDEADADASGGRHTGSRALRDRSGHDENHVLS